MVSPDLHSGAVAIAADYPASNPSEQLGHCTRSPWRAGVFRNDRPGEYLFHTSQGDRPAAYGDEKAEITLLTWGSTWGAANEAVQILASRGVSINQLHFCDLYPLRTVKLREVFLQSKMVIAVEQNITSQFAQLIRMQTGLEVTQHINKYDGRPMTPEWIIRELKEGGIL